MIFYDSISSGASLSATKTGWWKSSGFFVSPNDRCKLCLHKGGGGYKKKGAPAPGFVLQGPPRRAGRECTARQGEHNPGNWSGMHLPRGERGGNAGGQIPVPAGRECTAADSPNQSRTQSAPDSTPVRIHRAIRRELLRVVHHIPLRSIPIGISMRHWFGNVLSHSKNKPRNLIPRLQGLPDLT